MSSTTTAVVWSSQQTAIFNWFASPQEIIHHLVVRARAGTGKTTTIVEGVRRIPSHEDVMVCAFNKPIEIVLNARLKGTRAISKTIHSISFACSLMFRERLHPESKEERGLRADRLVNGVCGKEVPDTIKRLVSKLMTKGREMAPHATTLGDLTSLQIQFECEPEERWTRMGFGAAYVEQKALDAMELASQVKSGELIDFSDMIFLPVRNGWLVKQYDRVIVDEAQDLTTTQLEITLGILRDGGKMCIVGDDCQAVYAFRGADSESLDRLKEELSADELGLKTTYRCGRAIVEEARMFVPDFEAGPNNPEGLVSHLGLTALPGAAGPGDFVLSRVNAPLVSIAMRLLRAGKRARVAGRDIGMGLTSLVRRMKGASVEDLLNKIGLWEAREVARLEMLLVGSTDQRQRTVESKIEAIRDQASMLISLADGADSVNHVEDRIDALFKDDGMGIAGMVTCSSVHKAKGLEADRVFVLQDTMKHHNQEELNIQYVAITRAKHELVYVVDDRKETR